ncbi:MAG: DNA polymerase III subunit delta [Acidimicrobiales bacterium]
MQGSVPAGLAAAGSGSQRSAPVADAAPVYLVRGADEALLSQSVSAVVKEAQLAAPGMSRDLAVEELDLAETAASDLVARCSTPPFLAERRVVVARLDAVLAPAGATATDAGPETGQPPGSATVSGAGAALVEALVGYLQDPLATTILVLVSSRAVPARLTKVITNVGRIVDASPPGTSTGKLQWLGAKVGESGLRISEPAARLLAEHLGEDLGDLDGVIAKLRSAYAPDVSHGPGDGGRSRRLEWEDVEPFLGEAGGVPPWELTDPIDRGQTEEALIALRRFAGPGGRHPLVVVAVLHRHFEMMARLDGAGVPDVATAASLIGAKSRYVAEKALAQARVLGSERVGEAIVLVAGADADLRGGSGMPAPAVMDVLVARLARLAGVSRKKRR